MKYSSGHAEDLPASEMADNPTMPSRNFSNKNLNRRSFSGWQSQESEGVQGVFPMRSEFAGEPAPPSPIHNIVDHVPSKGKKTNMAKPADGAKRRLKLDTTQSDLRRSEKKHSFPENPQSKRELEEFKSSPRLLPPSRPAADAEYENGGRNPAGKACIVDVQHRSSAEMASVMMPEQVEKVSTLEPKYMVGTEIVSWATTGRRGAPECFRNTQQVAAQISKEAGGLQAVPPHSLGNVRDHRNSEVLQSHMQSFTPKWQEQLSVAPQVVTAQPQLQPGPTRAPFASDVGFSRGLPVAAGMPAETRIFSYGDVSSLPSTMPKDTAYLQSGLKVVKYGARTPGYFSPNMPHSQITGY